MILPAKLIEIFIVCRTCNADGMTGGQDCQPCGGTGYELAHVTSVDLVRAVDNNREAIQEAREHLAKILGKENHEG